MTRLLLLPAMGWIAVADAQVRRVPAREAVPAVAREPSSGQPQAQVSRQVRTYIDGALVDEGEVRSLRPEDATAPAPTMSGEGDAEKQAAGFDREDMSERSRQGAEDSLPAKDIQEQAASEISQYPAQDQGREVIDIHLFRSPADAETKAEEEPSANEQATPFWQRASTPLRQVGGGRGRRPSYTRTVADDTGDTSTATKNAAAAAPRFPSANLIIGEIVSVDPAHGTAVVWLQSRHIFIDQQVMSRTFELETTASLAPAQQRLGRAQGMVILEGMPRRGDEVVLSAATSE